MTNRFIRRVALARALGVTTQATYAWERSGKLPAATTIAYHVVGWYLNDLPPEFRRLFETEGEVA